MQRQLEQQIHTKENIDQYFLNASAAPHSAIESYQDALNTIVTLSLRPKSNLNIHLAISKCDRIIAYSQKSLNDGVESAFDLLNSAYFTKGILLSLQKDSHAAKHAFAKIAENIDSERLIVDYFSSNMQSVKDDSELYQDLINGLYFALWIHLRIDNLELYLLSPTYLKAGEQFKAKITREMLFNHVSDFDKLSLVGKEKDDFIKEYLQWFKRTMLNHTDLDARYSAWRTLELMYLKNPSSVEPIFLSLVYQYPGELSQSIQMDKVTKWLNTLTTALIKQNRTLKTIVYSRLDYSNLETLFAGIDQHRSLIEDKKKHCPNVLPYINSILKLLGNNTRVYPLHVMLGDIYLHIKHYDLAKEQFNRAVAISHTRTKALLGLAQLAFVQNKFEEAASFCSLLNESIDNTSAGIVILMQSKINNQKALFDEKLSKIRAYRCNIAASSSEIAKIIIHCDKWLRELNQEADIYPHLLLERSILKILHVKKTNVFLSEHDSIIVINNDIYREIYQTLLTIKSRLPNSYLMLMTLGDLHRLEGIAIQTRVNSHYRDAPELDSKAKEILNVTATKTFEFALEYYIEALEIDFSIETRWDIVLLQEKLKQYNHAKENCIVVYEGASDNTLKQRARFQLASLYAHLEDYSTAYFQFQSIIDELGTPDSPFSLANHNNEICSRIKLYFCAGQLAVKSNHLQAGLILLREAQILAQSVFTHDFRGCTLFYLSSKSLVNVDLFRQICLEEPDNTMPILVKDGFSHKLYIKIGEQYVATPFDLGDINTILSENGICVAPYLSMIVQGDYPDLYRHIREKTNYQYIHAWDKKVLNLINSAYANLLRQLATFATQALVSGNQSLFSSGTALSQVNRNLGENAGAAPPLDNQI